jgi:hypothetical protein
MKCLKKTLNSYLKQKNAIFPFLFYFLYNQSNKTDLAWGRAVGTSGRREEVEKGWRRVNMVQYYIYMYASGKMIPVETIPGKGIG